MPDDHIPISRARCQVARTFFVMHVGGHVANPMIAVAPDGAEIRSRGMNDSPICFRPLAIGEDCEGRETVSRISVTQDRWLSIPR